MSSSPKKGASRPSPIVEKAKARAAEAQGDRVAALGPDRYPSSAIVQKARQRALSASNGEVGVHQESHLLALAKRRRDVAAK